LTDFNYFPAAKLAVDLPTHFPKREIHLRKPENLDFQLILEICYLKAGRYTIRKEI